MSSTFSSMLKALPTNSAILAFLCSLFASVAVAETEPVRLGPGVYGVESEDPSGWVVRSVTTQQSVGFQRVIEGFGDCAEFVAGPLYDGVPRDPGRETWTIIQSFRVDCWALLQARPEARVGLAAEGDQITREMALEIMGYSRKLSDGSADWSKTLLDFSGGEFACKTAWRCTLSRSDGKNPPEQSVGFELVMATGDERYIRVTQMIYGRSGFVYGIRWRSDEDGGEVASIFPTFD